MVRMIFAIIYIFMVVLLAASCAVAKGRKSRFSVPVMRVNLAGAAAALFYTLYLLVSSYNRGMAAYFTSMYYIGIDWMMFFLTYFTMLYTEDRFTIKGPRYIMAVLLGVDTVSLLVNNFTGHMFTMQQAFSGSSGAYYWTVQSQPALLAHFILCYGMYILIFLALIHKIAVTPGFYRNKYMVIFIMLAANVLVNAVCFGMKLEVDLSVLMYAVLGELLCYFALYATPRKLVARTHSYVVEDIGNAIICFDIDGRCVYLNKAAKRLFSEWHGREDIDRIEARFKSWHAKNRSSGKDCDYWQDEFDIAGSRHYFGYEYRNLHDRRGDSIGCFFNIEDRTEEVRRFNEEQYRATHDSLTGLYNREGFFEKAQELLKKHENEPMYLLASNIKDFKLINELFGSGMGDKVIKKQAELIASNFKDDVVAGRIAGDKFALMLTKECFDEECFVKKVNELCSFVEHSIYKMHVYIGVYESNDAEEDVQTMYDKANIAIERIRGDYQQVVSYYDDMDMERLMQEKSVVSEFDRAIENREFCIYLQPQVDNTGRALGAEALVRWQHPERGLLFPSSFIEILEKAGLIYRLDYYIWEEAARKLAEWKHTGRGQYHISVNISAKDFYYLDLYEVFTALVKKYDIEPGRLNLEITETVIMSDVKNHMQLIDKLQSFGFHIEIDDFGSGYSSLNTLKDIKADVLKIDMLFLRETENQARSKTILNSIISMAKALNMPVITEGVETKNQVDFLSVMGCDIFQGYYFSKPVSVEEFEERYLKRA